MKILKYTFSLLLIFPLLANAQDMAEYTSGWEGEIENSKAFNFEVNIKNLDTKNASFLLSNHKDIIDYQFQPTNDRLLHIPFANGASFEGTVSKDGQEINGFIKSGMLFYHVILSQNENNSFVGNWNMLMVDELKSQNFYLSVENGSGNDYQAYPVLADDRFTGTWCANFQKDDDNISFVDFKTGLKFKGKLLPNAIKLNILLGEHLITQLDLKKSKTAWKIGGFKTDNKTSNLKLMELQSQVLKDSLPNTHSILISKNGELIFEEYYNGYSQNVPHDMRSASKSISSAIVGIASDKSLFNNVDQSIFDFHP